MTTMCASQRTSLKKVDCGSLIANLKVFDIGQTENNRDL